MKYPCMHTSKLLTAGRPSCNITPSSSLRPAFRRSYYTPGTPHPAAFPPDQSAILSEAVKYIPEHGFSHQSLVLGAQSAGYSSASTVLLPNGVFDLVRYHLISQRHALQATPIDRSLPNGKAPGVSAKLRQLIIARLHANESIIHKYHEALAIMSLAGNIPSSLAELGRLSDELWYLAGDVSVDTSYYTKRATLAGVYASTEVFMTQDNSHQFKDTRDFLDRRLDDVRVIGGTVGSVGQWASFTGMATVNVLRSWGAKI